MSQHNPLRLGIGIDWGQPQIQVDLNLFKRAETLGFHSAWSAEAYGSDAITPLAYLAGHTQHLKLGTAVAQVAARSPSSLAMSMATLDQLAGGNRVICGLGLSGPQVVEGWYGQAWGKPSSKYRDYVSILKSVWQRKGTVSYEGDTYSLPYAGDDKTGLGKPLKSILHANSDIPIIMGTGAPAMVSLTAEIADGWLPFGFVPGSYANYQAQLQKGIDKREDGKALDDFPIYASLQTAITDDVQAGLDSLKPITAMYVGGMGAKSKNFHKEAMIRRGYADAAETIQAAFLDRNIKAAIAAVPDEYIDDQSLIGPKARIQERLKRWHGSGATDLILHNLTAEGIEIVAQAAELEQRR